MAVEGVEAVRRRRADHLHAADGPARDVDDVAGRQNRGLAVERDLDDAGDDGVDPLAGLGLRGDERARRPGVCGYLVSAGLDLVPQRGLGDRAVATGFPPVDSHDGQHEKPALPVTRTGAAALGPPSRFAAWRWAAWTAPAPRAAGARIPRERRSLGCPRRRGRRRTGRS